MPVSQRKLLSTNADVGRSHLRSTLRRLSDAILADLTPLGHADTGFPVIELPPGPVRWILRGLLGRGMNGPCLAWAGRPAGTGAFTGTGLQELHLVW